MDLASRIARKSLYFNPGSSSSSEILLGSCRYVGITSLKNFGNPPQGKMGARGIIIKVGQLQHFCIIYDI